MFRALWCRTQRLKEGLEGNNSHFIVFFWGGIKNDPNQTLNFPEMVKQSNHLTDYYGYAYMHSAFII